MNPTPPHSPHSNEPSITCPSCKKPVKLTESLAAPIIEATRRQYEQVLQRKEADFTRREAIVRDGQAALAKAQAGLDEQVARKLQEQRGAIQAEEARKARQVLQLDLDQKGKEVVELQEALKAREGKLAEAAKAQADVMRKQRELEDARREMDLTIEKRVQDSLGEVKNRARQEAEDALKLRVAEKEQTIFAMQRQIEELKRKAEQGSQQLQGEILELELEALLRAKFPRDTIVPVPKGEFGGDVLQQVMSSLNQVCGTILWEFKRTKNWSDGWLAKLREDQRAAKAEHAVIVSHALPKDVETFDRVDGVWVVSPRAIVPVAMALRHSLSELALVRNAGLGQQTKMEMVYQYLTGPRFRHRVQAIVEKFTEMQEDLERERKVMTKMWAKREEQLRGAVDSTAGLYGDLQGIAGKTLQEIDGLDGMPMAELPEGRPIAPETN